MDATTAGDGFNYHRCPLVSARKPAAMSADETAVILTVGSGPDAADRQDVCVDFAGLSDRAGNPLPDGQVCFTVSFSPYYAKEELWYNIGSGNAVADLTTNPNYPTRPARCGSVRCWRPSPARPTNTHAHFGLAQAGR